MDKEKEKHTIRAAWITGILGLIGVICTVAVGLVIAYFQYINPVTPKTDVNVNIAITSQPPIVYPTVVIAVTNIVPTKVENILTIINNLDKAVCYIYISNAYSDDWGSEWLGEDMVLSRGRSVQFTYQPGYYDGLALDCNDRKIEEWYDIYLEGSMTWDVDGK